MDVRGSTNAFQTNLVQQVNRVTTIIQKGLVAATKDWPAMKIEDLQKNGYKGIVENDYTAANRAAKELVSMWYIEGYTGLDLGIPNGYNYNYSKYFPIGTYFAYASRFDDIIMSMLTVTKLDSIQLLLEPQNAVVGLRPAYMLEVFSKKPRTPEAMIDSAYQDTSITQCRACYSLDPSIYMTNYLKFGYIPQNLVINPKVIDPATMKARASVKSFIAN
jgi:hypothetical protein